MVSFSNQIRIMMSTRAGYRDHLREEICKAKAADTIDARNFRVERAGDYADLLAGSEAPEGIARISGARVGRCRLSIEWKIPL
jgi:hypothetical protein